MKKYRAVIITPWYTPYRVPVLREVALRSEFEMTVIFCTPLEPGREWPLPPDLPFKAIHLNFKPFLSCTRRSMFGEKTTFHIPENLVATLKSIKPHVIVGLEFRLDCLAAMLYALANRCGYVTWSDMTCAFDQRMGKVRFLVRRLLLSRSKALIASSSDTQSHFHRQHGYPRDRIFISTLGSHVNELIESAGVKPGTPQHVHDLEGVRFLYVGNLIPLKGVDLLISAFARLRRRWPKARLTIIGEGRDRSSLQDLARQSGCSSSVEFKGHVRFDRIPGEMILHDVLVFPTKLDAFGLVVAEAVACGLPVICSCFAGAANDLVKDNGLIIDPHDTTALADAMERMMPADVRRKMTEASRRVLPALNLDAAADSFCEALRAGVGKRRDRGTHAG